MYFSSFFPPRSHHPLLLTRVAVCLPRVRRVSSIVRYDIFFHGKDSIWKSIERDPSRKSRLPSSSLPPRWTARPLWPREKKKLLHARQPRKAIPIQPVLPRPRGVLETWDVPLLTRTKATGRNTFAPDGKTCPLSFGKSDSSPPTLLLVSSLLLSIAAEIRRFPSPPLHSI